MVYVRVAGTWKQDRSLRAALGRGGGEAQEAILHAVDAIAIEVDGIDLCAGQAEGALVQNVEALGQGLLSLLAGRARAHVHFGEGGLELVVARRGASALLTVVTLRRPARVLARDVEIDLAELVRATHEAASALAAELRGFHAWTDPAARSLAALASRLEQARAAPESAPPPLSPKAVTRPRTESGAPACTFELRDDADLIASYRPPGADLGSLLAPGRLVLRASDGRDIVATEGPPFLAFRELVAFAGRIAAAARRESTASASLAGRGRNAEVVLEADLASGSVVRDRVRSFPCPPLLLGRAICEAAGDLVGVVVARNPWQERNHWITELRSDAAERRAQIEEILAGDVVAPPGVSLRQRRVRALPATPLAPGRMRRMVFRRRWTADVGTPAALALGARAEHLLAAGSACVVALDPATGRERWRRSSGATAGWVRDEALFFSDGVGLVSVDPSTGADRWALPVDRLPHGSVWDVRRVAGGGAVAVGPGSLAAIDPSGRITWTFAPPAAVELRTAAHGPLVLAASDAGFLYALDAASGQLRWRVHVPGPLAAVPTAHGAASMLVCTTDLGGSVVSIDPATGRRAFEVPLDVTPTSAPVAFAGLLGIAGSVGGDLVVTAVDPAGRLAWEDAPPLGPGPAALATLRSSLLAKTADGACAAIDRSGATIWTLRAACAHPPPANPPPVVARGVALVPSEEVAAIDARTGAFLGGVPIPAPVRLVCDAALNAWGVDAEGVITAVRLETHLSVL